MRGQSRERATARMRNDPRRNNTWGTVQEEVVRSPRKTYGRIINLLTTFASENVTTSRNRSEILIETLAASVYVSNKKSGITECRSGNCFS